jgi:hypothetical protein
MSGAITDPGALTRAGGSTGMRPENRRRRYRAAYLPIGPVSRPAAGAPTAAAASRSAPTEAQARERAPPPARQARSDASARPHRGQVSTSKRNVRRLNAAHRCPRARPLVRPGGRLALAGREASPGPSSPTADADSVRPTTWARPNAREPGTPWESTRLTRGLGTRTASRPWTAIGSRTRPQPGGRRMYRHTRSNRSCCPVGTTSAACTLNR